MFRVTIETRSCEGENHQLLLSIKIQAKFDNSNIWKKWEIIINIFQNMFNKIINIKNLWKYLKGIAVKSEISL